MKPIDTKERFKKFNDKTLKTYLKNGRDKDKDKNILIVKKILNDRHTKKLNKYIKKKGKLIVKDVDKEIKDFIKNASLLKTNHMFVKNFLRNAHLEHQNYLRKTNYSK